LEYFAAIKLHSTPAKPIIPCNDTSTGIDAAVSSASLPPVISKS